MHFYRKYILPGKGLVKISYKEFLPIVYVFSCIVKHVL